MFKGDPDLNFMKGLKLIYGFLRVLIDHMLRHTKIVMA